jgi:acetyltransferase-like isoleucine patch superfamily enzyme
MLRKIFSLALSCKLKWQTRSVHMPRVIWPAFLNFPPGQLQLEGQFFAGRGLYVSTNRYSPIRIGDRVTIGPDVKILGGNHKIDFTAGHIWDFNDDNPVIGGIVIGDGVWIGANSIILEGSNIGEGCVVGAGSVVTGFLPPWSVVGGVPARKIRTRFSDDSDLKAVLLATGSRLSVENVRNS